jgi:hypothetical protein
LVSGPRSRELFGAGRNCMRHAALRQGKTLTRFQGNRGVCGVIGRRDPRSECARDVRCTCNACTRIGCGACTEDTGRWARAGRPPCGGTRSQGCHCSITPERQEHGTDTGLSIPLRRATAKLGPLGPDLYPVYASMRRNPAPGPGSPRRLSENRQSTAKAV